MLFYFLDQKHHIHVSARIQIYIPLADGFSICFRKTINQTVLDFSRIGHVKNIMLEVLSNIGRRLIEEQHTAIA